MASLTLLGASVCALVALGIEYYVIAIAYPAFGMIGAREFAAIHALHSERIAFVIGPALLGACGLNALLVVSRPRGVPVVLAVGGAAAGALVLGYTAFVAVPLHVRLGDGAEPKTIAALNATEWIRGLATLAQASCDVAMLWLALEGAPERP